MTTPQDPGALSPLRQAISTLARAVRAHTGCTWEQFDARVEGLSRSALRRAARQDDTVGERPPRLEDLLEAYAQALDIEVIYLVITLARLLERAGQGERTASARHHGLLMLDAVRPSSLDAVALDRKDGPLLIEGDPIVIALLDHAARLDD